MCFEAMDTCPFCRENLSDHATSANLFQCLLCNKFEANKHWVKMHQSLCVPDNANRHYRIDGASGVISDAVLHECGHCGKSVKDLALHRSKECEFCAFLCHQCDEWSEVGRSDHVCVDNLELCSCGVKISTLKAAEQHFWLCPDRVHKCETCENNSKSDHQCGASNDDLVVGKYFDAYVDMPQPLSQHFWPLTSEEAGNHKKWTHVRFMAKLSGRILVQDVANCNYYFLDWTNTSRWMLQRFKSITNHGFKPGDFYHLQRRPVEILCVNPWWVGLASLNISLCNSINVSRMGLYYLDQLKPGMVFVVRKPRNLSVLARISCVEQDFVIFETIPLNLPFEMPSKSVIHYLSVINTCEPTWDMTASTLYAN
jgi:hypothetical protein